MTKARKKVRTAKRAGPRRRESVAVRRKRAAAIGKALHKLYPGADCALQHRSALNLLVSTILSAQCTDDRVNKVTPSVFKRYKTAKDFARANPADLEDLIRSTGFFRNKTKNIIGAGRVLTERFGGRVPDTMEDLIELPGVSRKTANVLLGTWFKKNEGFVVDTHVGRLAHRLGLTWRSRDDKDAVKIERDLMDVFSQKEWTFLGHALIWHGRKVCPARKPDCQRCTLARWCPSAFSFEAPPQSKSEARTERGRVAPLARARIESSRTTPKPRRSRGSQRRAGAGRVTQRPAADGAIRMRGPRMVFRMARFGLSRGLQSARPLGHQGHALRHVAILLTAGLTGCSVSPGFAPPSPPEPAINVNRRVAEISDTAEPVFRRQPIFDTIPGKTGHHASTLTAFQDGELLAAWYSYDGPNELDGSEIYTARRSPGVDAWEPPRLHIDRPIGDGNPVLYSEGDEVWLFQAVVLFGWSTAHIEVQRSHDRGRTWTAPRVINGPIGSNVRSPPVRTAAGDLLLPAYDDLLPRSLFFASPDGEAWRLRAAVFTGLPHANIQPAVVRLDNGRLLAVMRNTGGGWLWAMASDDSGRTWSSPRDSGFPNSGSAAALLRLANGHLVLIFNDSATERRPLSIALSADEGRTWSAPKVIADGDTAYSYPAAIQTPDELIHVLYTQGRRSIDHVTLNEAWILAP